jgi:hypothetical protein
MADCPREAEAAVDVNSPDAAAVDAPAFESPAEAALALGDRCVEEEEGVEGDEGDEFPAKARSGPNSRLALLAGVNAALDVAADGDVDRPDTAPTGCTIPDTAPVSR